MRKKRDSIMAELDRWVRIRGNGKWVPEKDSLPIPNYGLDEDYGIQQIRSEIVDFVDLLLQRSTRSIVEIGLGYFGSTHFLWRKLFERVVSIERNHSRVLDFGKNTRDFYRGEWQLKDGKSSLVIGFSNEARVVGDIYRMFPDGIDALFIDGDHAYNAVLQDWLLYEPLVRAGGIVAFHDIKLETLPDRGPKGFLADLAAGKIDREKRYEIREILHSSYHGIGYYVKQ
jgi:cephalosporin hydroxylase